MLHVIIFSLSISEFGVPLTITLVTAQKMKISIKDFFSKCDHITFTEEILNGKLHIFVQ